MILESVQSKNKVSNNKENHYARYITRVILWEPKDLELWMFIFQNTHKTELIAEPASNNFMNKGNRQLD